MPKKNKEYWLDIESYGSNGEGIGHIDGYTLFVKGALPGEHVKVVVTKTNKTYGYARLLEVENESPDRTEPMCPVAGPCGGCGLQHIDYDAQLRFKAARVKECLERIGGVEGLPEEIEIRGCEMPEGDYVPWYYRNKAMFPVGRDADGIPSAGFFAPRSHRLIPCEHCLLQDAEINRIVVIVMDHMRKVDKDVPIVYDEQTHTGWLRHIYVRRGYATDQTLICLVVNDRLHKNYLFDEGRKYRIDELVETIENEPGMTTICLNQNTEKTNVVLGDKFLPVTGPLYIEDTVGSVRYRIGPESFYQINPHMTQQLYDTALEFADLKGNETVWDLYCGIGTISLYFARKTDTVIGVEIVPQAIEDARENAKINGLGNAIFFCGAAEDLAVRMAEGSISDATDDEIEDVPFPDVVVVDPPRKGCDESVIAAIGAVSPSRIVYVSCDPATLARDVERLSEFGYTVQRVRAIDQFWQTRHVETVCLLSE